MSDDLQVDIGSMSKEVWFLIAKDQDGYPESRTWEGLWTQVVDGNHEITSVPFFVKNVSRGDWIKVEEGGFTRFVEIVRHNGHNTYRLLMLEASEDDVQIAIDELESKGMTVELHENGILLAVDVPPVLHQKEIDDYLSSNCDQGRWSIQDGYLASNFN